MKRLITSAALIPTVLGIIFGPFHWLLLGAVLLVACLCYREFASIAAASGVRVLGPAAYAAGAVLVLVPREDVIFLVLFALMTMVVVMGSGDLAEALPRASATLLGVVYVFGCWRFAPLLQMRDPHWLAFGLSLNWVGDGAAYYVGRRFGRHRLAPRVSPKKSWEGSVASAAASALFGVLWLGRFLPQVPLWKVAAIALAANAAGQLGDLAESAIKRGANVKDSGTLLPGHGGMLDRVDSSMFALPVIYALLLVL